MRTNRHLLLTVFVGLSGLLNAQNLGWDWGYSDGGPGNDLGYGISTSGAGESYVTGRFNASATFGNITLTSAGGPDIFIAKYDINGNCLWANRCGSTDAGDPYGDEGRGIDIDALGNCYATGNCQANAQFGSFTFTNTMRQIYVVKYNSNGTICWARQPLSGPYNNYSRAIAVDETGSCYITGYLGGGSNTFGAYAINGPGAYVVKYDSSGTVMYATKLGVSGALDAYGIDVDLAGNAYVTGYLQGSETINSQTYTSMGTRDVFVIKVNTSGNFAWMKLAGGPTVMAMGNAISLDSQRNIYITGDHDSAQMFFDANVIPGTLGREMFIAKYDSSGNNIWARSSTAQSSPGSTTQGFGIKAGLNSSLFVTGEYYAPVDFGSCSISQNGTHTFIVRYDALGNCSSSLTSTNGNPGAFGYGISIDNNGSAYITGFHKAPTTFGNYTTAFMGGEDMFIARTDLSSGIEDETSGHQLQISPNPCDGTFLLSYPKTDLGAVHMEIVDVLGKKILEMRLTNQETLIDLSSRASGIYLIRVIDERGTSIQRLVIQ